MMFLLPVLALAAIKGVVDVYPAVLLISMHFTLQGSMKSVRQ
ncbi:hypothetical protein HNQ50_001886 [Silvimonas terrae]|uniref:Uncharacterized protein n=1 Tax=Silvimonas terrae TaxID=300266 RepID=A0A840RFS1_9NEIS|nr:hypothetical protein [Silvimonas terrae]MBB5191163.1 hypothetical protein [Silvimonas terrae]